MRRGTDARPGITRWLTGCKYAFIALTFTSILHVNVAVPYLGASPGMSADPDRARSLAGQLYGTVLAIGHRIGMASEWKMYSPVPRWLRLAECQARDPQGRWVPVPLPNMGPAYRDTRSLASAMLWDFKNARILDNHFYYAYDPAVTRAYLRHHAERLTRTLGWTPQALRVVVRGAPIPAPGQRGDWTPQAATLDHVLAEYEYP